MEISQDRETCMNHIAPCGERSYVFGQNTWSGAETSWEHYQSLTSKSGPGSLKHSLTEWSIQVLVELTSWDMTADRDPSTPLPPFCYAQFSVSSKWMSILKEYDFKRSKLLTCQGAQSLLVHSGYCHSIPQTWWWQGGINEQQKLISHCSGASKSKIKTSALWCLVKALFLVHNWLLLAMSSHGGRGRGFLQSLSCYKALILFMKTLRS